MQTLRASLRFLCVVFGPSSYTPCSARPRRERMREEWTASPLSPGWEEPAGVSRSRRPLPTSTTRGQQSVVAAARVGEEAGAEKGRLGVAGRMPVHFLIKLFLESFCDRSSAPALAGSVKAPRVGVARTSGQALRLQHPQLRPQPLAWWGGHGPALRSHPSGEGTPRMIGEPNSAFKNL